jgi:hypothetical protein
MCVTGGLGVPPRTYDMQGRVRKGERSSDGAEENLEGGISKIAPLGKFGK